MKKINLLIFLLLAVVHISFAQGDKYLKVKIFTHSKTDFLRLASLGVISDGVEYKPGEFLIGEFSEEEVALIKQTGFSFDILIPDVTDFYTKRNKGVDVDAVNRSMRVSRKSIGGYKTPQNFTLGSMGGFHTYNEMLSELDEMKTLYPDLISEKNQIGSNTTIEGRQVFWVRISNNPEVDQQKPKVLYTALTHAREPASLQQMLYQMWYLLENYETDSEIKYLIDNLEMYFIPCVNPDGYIYNQVIAPNGGGMWRKNRRNNFDGSMGVDLNRNFGFMWGYDDTGSSPVGNSSVYRGTAPFSEPETQLIKQFCEEREISLALNNHTYSDVLIYPWGYENLLTPDNLLLREYAKLLTSENGYVYGTCFETLNYTANGGSDDWFYGDQQSKNKIFAFTPEAGKPSDGFWPQVSRIEEICAGHTAMNLYLARFALAYARITDKSLPFFPDLNSSFSFDILCLGIDVPSTFTVSLNPVSSNIESVGEPQIFSNMTQLQSQSSSIPVYLKSSANQGEEVVFTLEINNGTYTRIDTIKKFYGTPQYVVDHGCNDMNGWSSSYWGPTSNHFFSSPSSLTDSPLGLYSSNSNNSISLAQDIDLTQSLMGYVEFMARWNIETNWDYAQFMVSDNGGLSWTPLKGEYTSIGGENQDIGEPLYHGQKNEWVKEFISLNDFIGKVIKLRFRLVSDANINDDGFYFDDFKVVRMQDPQYTSIIDYSDVDDNLIINYISSVSELQVNWNSKISFNRIDLVDMQGRYVFSKKSLNSTEGFESNSIVISTQKLNPGVYIVRLSGKDNFTKKIVL